MGPEKKIVGWQRRTALIRRDAEGLAVDEGK